MTTGALLKLSDAFCVSGVSSQITPPAQHRPATLLVTPGNWQDLTAEGTEGWGLGNPALSVMRKCNFWVTVTLFRSLFCPDILPLDDWLGAGADRLLCLGRVLLFLIPAGNSAAVLSHWVSLLV